MGTLTSSKSVEHNFCQKWVSYYTSRGQNIRSIKGTSYFLEIDGCQTKN